jgi:hypothetical protein
MEVSGETPTPNRTTLCTLAPLLECYIKHSWSYDNFAELGLDMAKKQKTTGAQLHKHVQTNMPSPWPFPINYEMFLQNNTLQHFLSQYSSSRNPDYNDQHPKWLVSSPNDKNPRDWFARVKQKLHYAMKAAVQQVDRVLGPVKGFALSSPNPKEYRRLAEHLLLEKGDTAGPPERIDRDDEDSNYNPEGDEDGQDEERDGDDDSSSSGEDSEDDYGPPGLYVSEKGKGAHGKKGKAAPGGKPVPVKTPAAKKSLVFFVCSRWSAMIFQSIAPAPVRNWGLDFFVNTQVLFAHNTAFVFWAKRSFVWLWEAF